MKKFLLVIGLLISVNMMFAQSTATFSIPDEDITGYTVGQTVAIDITVPAISNLVYGFQIFLEYNDAILLWAGANTTPAPGVAYINPAIQGGVLTSDWLWNETANQLAFSWLEPNFLAVTIAPGSTLITLNFTYQGGINPGESTPINFGTVSKWNYTSNDDVKLEKGVTELYDENFGIYTLSLDNGMVFIPGGPTAISWDGSESTDWFDGDNWVGGAYPAITDDVIIPNGMPNYPQVLLDPVLLEVAVCNNITVESSALVIVGPDGYMTVDGTFDNQGFVGIISDANYSGSLICANLTGTNYQYWRYLGITGDPADDQTGWHYISSPTANFGSYNMYDYFLNTWNEPTSLWVNHGGSPTIPCTPGTQIFNDGMEGWSVKWDNMYASYGCPNAGTLDVVEFIGPYNTGNQTSTITYTGVGMYPGFNLVGNPYPSYWDYDGFYFGPNWPATGLNDAIYYWDESANQYASYVLGVGNNGGGRYVPPVQGFFFEAVDPSVNLTFTQAEQVHVTGLPFWKEDPIGIVRLEVAANGYTDQTTIKFNENATIERDKVDARKLFSGGVKVPSLYTMGGNVELSINQQPETVMVPVYFKCETSGVYTISAIETSEFQNVVLEDLVAKTQTDLLAGDYSFEYTAGENAGRFILHFTPLGTPELSANSINIWAANQTIYVQAPATTGDIVVFNMMGQEVVRTSIVPGLNEIPMNDVNTYYIVKVLGSDITETGKVFIK